MARAAVSPWKKQLTDLQRLVRTLEDDLRKRTEQLAPVKARWKARWEEARRKGRTQATYESWRDEYLTQVAVAWVLSCIFVRFLEDNDLVADLHLAGEGPRLQEAFEAHEAFFREHPTLTDREYLQHVLRTIAQLPSMDGLLGVAHSPLWDADFELNGTPRPLGEANLTPSGDAAKHLLEFWQQRDPATGKLLRSFRQAPSGQGSADADAPSPLDTRLLGDLYQDLSEAARKHFALLQTPDFVEEFILDRTLEPAIHEFGLAKVRMIDPTCGSGHFLLGGFHRLFNHWMKQEPGQSPSVLAQRALNSVYGVDLNPFAVAIARFRLVIAALRACGLTRLKDAPGFGLNIASGDSLLHGRRYDRHGQVYLPKHTLIEWLPQPYAIGDFDHATRILTQQYHAVVGNPPYITDQDPAHREVVRQAYESCYRQFSLGVPFTERFFDLAQNETASQAAGMVGLITTNSFMKREFGKVIIERVLPRLDLTHVLDTSGAYIPGHGTPTVILFGRNRLPSSPTVRAAMGIRGEPGTPEDPAQGEVWHSILRMMDTPGQQDEFITIADMERSKLERHPWSLGGGGLSELKSTMESSCPGVLKDCVEMPIGRAVRIAEEEIFFFGQTRRRHTRASSPAFRALVIGEVVRDWSCAQHIDVWYPYGHDNQESLMLAELWHWRTTLAQRSTFQGNMEDAGLRWFDYMQHTTSAYRTPLSITFAFVSTHNHFVLDRGGKVFNRSAPVIKLPPGSTEDDHLALLGLLNSSVACFWMKQVMTGKHKGDGGQAHADPAHQRFEFDGTKLAKFPIPRHRNRIIELARMLDKLATMQQDTSPRSILARDIAGVGDPRTIEAQATALLKERIALQEELDWACYEAYGLLPESDIAARRIEHIPTIALGQRAFEIDMARKMSTGELSSIWFDRHGSTPTTSVPLDWPPDYRAIVDRRLELIEDHPYIGLVEKPEFKRRWSTEAWSSTFVTALRSWLLDRLEAPQYWPDPALISCANLADALRRDADFMAVAALYRGHEAFDLTVLVTELVLSEGVPYLPRLRYTPSGLEKRKQWEDTWSLQRREDAGEKLSSPIPVPPKYTNTDFLKGEYWRLRGKLDVPKERFILYPGAERESDQTPVLGWAGWDHLQQAQALAAYLLRCKDDEGWPRERLRPLIDGLQELLPWLLQWHNDMDPDHGERLGDFYKGFVTEQALSLGFALNLP